MALITCPECGASVSDKADKCPRCAFPIGQQKPSENSLGNVFEINAQKNQEDRNVHWRHFSVVSYLAIGLLFLLPFCDISCSGTKIISMSGIQMVTGTNISYPNLDFSSIENSKDTKEVPSNLWAVLAFALAIFGFFVSIVYSRTNLLAGFVGICGAFVLGMLQYDINQKISERGVSIISASFGVGYWGAIIIFIVVAILNFVTVKSLNRFSSSNYISGIIIIIIAVIIGMAIAKIMENGSTRTLFSFGPSAKELEEKRIADSIRVADSLAMVFAEQQRVADSIAKVQEKSRNNDFIEQNEMGELSNIIVTASSYMPPSSGFTYYPNNVTDDNLQTWWSPSKPNSDGMNSWIKLDFNIEKQISGIKIHGGSHCPNFQNYGNIYKMNNRLTNANLEFSDGSTISIELKDIDEIQEIKFPVHTTRYIILRPIKWLKGSKWKDLCISYFKPLEKK